MIVTGDARNLLDHLGGQEFGVILVDAPWPYDNQLDHDPRRGGYTYEPMTMADIFKMPVRTLAAKNCALYSWGTWPKLPFCWLSMKWWGFKYVTGFPWIKLTKDWSRPVYRNGWWVAGCSEFVLVGKRGKVSPPPAADRPLGLLGPSFKHSRKPDSVHEMIEGNPNLTGPYLELFARRDREGWTCFGNKVEPLGAMQIGGLLEEEYEST
jgi:N6-adenosine-specific RNA methylase IME4